MKIKSAATIVLMAFLGMVAFGLIFMMDISMNMDERMADQCPLTVFGGEVCPQSALGVAIHHISVYQSLTSVPVNFGIAAFVIFLLIFISAIAAVFINSARFGLPAIIGFFYNFPPSTSYTRKITRWLSLHENSPAVS